MIKLKIKSTGVKVKEHNVGAVKMMSHSGATHIIDGITEQYKQPEVKEKKLKAPTKKVVYISKYGSKAIFDSINLCAKIFGKDKSTIKYRIKHPMPKYCTDEKEIENDWLKGGRLEYIN